MGGKNIIKNVIFDWSGTLSDDIDCIYTTIMNMFRRLGLEVITIEEFKEEAGLPYMKFYRKFTSIPKKEIDRLYKQEISLAEKPKPFPGVKKLLEYLFEEQINVMVLSSNPQKLLEQEIKDYGFQKFFIEARGDIHDKTKAISDLLKKSGFVISNPKENLVVGDMVHDIRAGKKIGAITVAVTQGCQSKEKLAAANPDFLRDSIIEVKQIIKRHI